MCMLPLLKRLYAWCRRQIRALCLDCSPDDDAIPDIEDGSSAPTSSTVPGKTGRHGGCPPRVPYIKLHDGDDETFRATRGSGATIDSSAGGSLIIFDLFVAIGASLSHMLSCACCRGGKKLRQSYAKLRLRHPFVIWYKAWRQRRKMQQVFARFANRPLFSALGTWRAKTVEALRAREKLRRATMSLVLRPVRKAFNAWTEQASESKAASEKRRAALKRMSPEGRMMRAAVAKMHEEANFGKKLRRGARAIANRGLVAGFNSWRDGWREQRAQEEVTRRALARMSPEGRAMLQVMRTLRALVEAATRAKAAMTKMTPEGRAMLGALRTMQARVEETARARAALARMSPEGRMLTRAINQFKKCTQAASTLRRGSMAFHPAGRAFNQWKSLGAKRTQGYQTLIWKACQSGGHTNALVTVFTSVEPAAIEPLLTVTDKQTGLTPLLTATRGGYARVVELLVHAASPDLPSTTQTHPTPSPTPIAMKPPASAPLSKAAGASPSRGTAALPPRRSPPRLSPPAHGKAASRSPMVTPAASHRSNYSPPSSHRLRTSSAVPQPSTPPPPRQVSPGALLAPVTPSGARTPIGAPALATAASPSDAPSAATVAPAPFLMLSAAPSAAPSVAPSPSPLTPTAAATIAAPTPQTPAHAPAHAPAATPIVPPTIRELVLSATDGDGASALHHACRLGHEAIVRLLLAGGARVDARSSTDGSTPLHWAANRNNVASCRLLLAAHADASRTNEWGSTALENAQIRGCYDVVQLLSEAAHDHEASRAAKMQAELQRKLRPSEAERKAQSAQLQAEARASKQRRRGEMEEKKEQLAASRAAEKQAVQLEARMAAADKALHRALDTAAGRKPQTSHASEPWLDFTRAEHEELRRAVGEARAAGSDAHLLYSERLRQAVRMLDALDAHAAGRPVITISPIKHSSERGIDADVEKATLRRKKIAAKKGQAKGGGGKAREVRL